MVLESVWIQFLFFLQSEEKMFTLSYTVFPSPREKWQVNFSGQVWHAERVDVFTVSPTEQQPPFNVQGVDR